MGNRYKKVCLNCGETLPEDSEFCQYCGSGDIKTVEINQPKRCLDCDKEVPGDSIFCPYCGSKNLYTDNDEVKTVLICNKCGKELPSDSRFCQYCGSDDLNRKKLIVRSDRENNKLSTKYDPSDKKSNRKTKSFSEICITLIFWLFVLGVPLIVGIEYYEGPEIDFSNGKIVYSFFVTNSDKAADLETYTTFKVIAPVDKNVYVVIKKDGSKIIGSFLVKAGESHSLYLRKGDYKVYYAIGKKWHGKEKLFGIFTSYYQDVVHTSNKNYFIWTADCRSINEIATTIPKNDFPKDLGF